MRKLSESMDFIPKTPENIPKHSQWLSGQGCGVWFCIEKLEGDNLYSIKRYSVDGDLDCEGIFFIEDDSKKFNIKEDYNFRHISHCMKCEIEQAGYRFKFLRV